MPRRLRRAIPLGAAVLWAAVWSRAVCARNELFVTNVGNNSITVYVRTAAGNMAPVRTIIGAATGLNGPHGIVVDTVHDEILVVNEPANSVTVYSRTAMGNAAPLRTLQGLSTGMSGPFGLAVDTVNDEIFVANVNNAVRVFSRTANGDVAPIRILSASSTGLSSPQDVALGEDRVRSTLYTKAALGLRVGRRHGA